MLRTPKKKFIPQNGKQLKKDEPGPTSRATVPVTTKMPAPMEAPTPMRTRSSKPSRRTSPSPTTRTEFSDGETCGFVLSAEEQKLDHHVEDEDEELEDDVVL